MSSAKLKIALLGHRGMIGMMYQRLLAHHPWFSVHPIAHVTQAYPYPVVLTALPSQASYHIDQDLAQHGCCVISSAAAHRKDPKIPLLIPEINPEHTALLNQKRGWIVTKPNCTVHTFLLPLAPLHKYFTIKALHITSMQALSGGGKATMQDPYLRQHVCDHIPDEEEKCKQEPKKILGTSDIRISAACHRVPVEHGHVVSVCVSFKKRPLLNEILECWQSFSPPLLPSSVRPLIVYQDTHLPKLPENGMQVACSRLQYADHFDVQFTAYAHNLIRGGAGAGCLIAEHLYQEGRYA